MEDNAASGQWTNDQVLVDYMISSLKSLKFIKLKKVLKHQLKV